MAETETTAEVAEREAEAVEEAYEAEEAAAQKRQAQMERAADAKGYPKDADPPSQKGSGEDAKYSQERLIADSQSLTGFPSHVMAGALHGNTSAYLSVADASKRAEKWLSTEVTTGDEG